VKNKTTADFHRLLSLDVANASEDELRVLVKHLQEQVRDTYVYLVGEWNQANRARSIRNGQMVANQEVIDFLSQT
jgi:hypothetical protein